MTGLKAAIRRVMNAPLPARIPTEMVPINPLRILQFGEPVFAGDRLNSFVLAMECKVFRQARRRQAITYKSMSNS